MEQAPSTLETSRREAGTQEKTLQEKPPQEETPDTRRSVFNVLKSTLLQGRFQARGTVLSEYEIATVVLEDISPGRSAVVEALGKLEALSLIERRTNLSSGAPNANSGMGWTIRELPLEDKLDLICQEHVLVAACTMEAIRKIQADPLRLEPIQKTFGKMENAFHEFSNGTQPQFRNLIHSYNAFLGSIAEAAIMPTFSETLSNIGDRLSFARVIWPDRIETILEDARCLLRYITALDTQEALQVLDQHFAFFKRWFNDAIIQLKEIRDGNSEAVAELVSSSWPMIRRSLNERWNVLGIDPRITTETQWEELRTSVNERARENIQEYVQGHRTGNLAIWFIKLAGYILRDPAELLEVISIVCSDTEQKVLRCLAGVEREQEISVSPSSARTARFRGKKAVQTHLETELGYRVDLSSWEYPNDPLYCFLSFFDWA